jgi:hypothetical protein
MGTMTGATMATAAVTANRTPPSPAPTALPGTLAAPAPLLPNALPAGAVPMLAGNLVASTLAQNAPLAQNAALAQNAPLLPNAAVAATTGLNINSSLPGVENPVAAPRQTTPVDPDTTKPLLLLSQRVNDRGQIVVRVVDLEGKITERSLNAAGQLIVKKGAANARLLPLVREYVDPKGEYVRLVRDTYGAILELDFTAQGKLSRVRVLNRPDADVNGAGAVAAQLPSAISRLVNSLGQVVQHQVLTNGTIVESVVDRAGNLVQQRSVGSVLSLPALLALAQPNGQLIVVARDPTGALLEIALRASDRMLLSLRTLDTGVAAPR